MNQTQLEEAISECISKTNMKVDTSNRGGAIMITPIDSGYIDTNMPSSLFDFSETEKGYIAGISGITSGSFISDGSHDNLKYISSTDNTIIDAEKDSDRPEDVMMCWAATDSNMLFQTGWLTDSVFSEDDLFDQYRSSFLSNTQYPGHPYYGAEWYLTGQYVLSNCTSSVQRTSGSQGSGGYFSDSVTNANMYLNGGDVACGTYIVIENMVNALKKGNAVGFTVKHFSSSGQIEGHVITLRGYTYEKENNDSQSRERVTGLIVADSDDDKSSNPRNAINVLKQIPICYLYGHVFLDGRYLSSQGYPCWISYAMEVKPAQFMTMSNGGLVSSAATLLSKTIAPGTELNVSFGGLANQTVLAGGSAHVFGGGRMIVSTGTPSALGEITLGGKMIVDSSMDFSSATVTYQLDANTPENDPLITNLSNMGGIASLGLNIDGREKYGTYTLAFNGSADFLSTRTVTVTNISNNTTSGSLNSQTSILTFSSGPDRDYTLKYNGGVMTLDVDGSNIDKTTRCDFHYNGISDVIYVSGGTEAQLLRYGLDGTSGIQDMGNQNPDMKFIGGYDMTSDHKADLITFYRYGSNSTYYIEIGYAESGDLSRWHRFDEHDFGNPNNVDWVVKCGNLTGNQEKNSILWHAPSLGALGYWADAGGDASWVTIGNVYDSNWEVIGLGDFINDSVHKDAVLFRYGGNAFVEITANNGYRVLGTPGSDWDVVAIGDFSNDGVDDLILYNASSGMVDKWADGVETGWSRLGPVDAGTSIEGAGDYNGDGSMDLLARKSDGTMGYYASANLSQFTSFGYTMNSSWAVIA